MHDTHKPDDPRKLHKFPIAYMGGVGVYLGIVAGIMFSYLAPVHGLLTTVETEIKYAGYLAQQGRQIQRMKEAEGRKIPAEFDFSRIPGLSTEVRQKLDRVRPETLGQAGRIPGVTPAAVAVLDVYLSLV